MPDDLTVGYDADHDDTDDIEDDQSVSYLSSELASTLNPWNRLCIGAVNSPKTKNGDDYTSLIFVDKDRSYKVRENFFQGHQFKKLAKALNLTSITKRSQLLKQWVWCKFGVRVVGDKEYVSIIDYRASEPVDNSPTTTITNVQGAEVPF